MKVSLSGYGDACILVRGTITVRKNGGTRNKNVTFRIMHHLITESDKYVVPQKIIQSN